MIDQQGVMEMTKDKCHGLRIQSGFSLLEVLVGAVVFIVGLGGVSLMLMSSVHGSVEARSQTLASMHAASLAELILMNPASLGHYINPEVLTEDCSTAAGCTPAQWAAGNLARWQVEIRQGLADASGVVCRDSTPDDGDTGDPACDEAGPALVKVFWREPVRGFSGDTLEGEAPAASDSQKRLFLPVSF